MAKSKCLSNYHIKKYFLQYISFYEINKLCIPISFSENEIVRPQKLKRLKQIRNFPVFIKI